MDVKPELLLNPLVAALHAALSTMGYDGPPFLAHVASIPDAVVAINSWVSHRRGRMTIILHPSTALGVELISAAVRRLIEIEALERERVDIP